jgi:CheY-like chemotaxis protein
VDDEADMRKVLMLLLKRQGYECEEVGNAFAAMHWFENNHADLVITDIHQGSCMQDKGKWIHQPTGIELLEYLSNKSGEKPSIMIVVSGNMYYNPTYSERARKAGAKGLLSKPFDKNELLTLIPRGDI